MDASELNVKKIRTVRWTLLQAMYAGRPYPVKESLLGFVLKDTALELTTRELRSEIMYLEDRKLVEIEQKHTLEWDIRLLRYGVDIVEYTVDCDAGIARPQLRA